MSMKGYPDLNWYTRIPEMLTSPLSTPAHIASQLREHIATGVLPPGTPLSDKALASQLNISRTPVREALLQLRSEGLVVARPQSGTFVFDPDEKEVAEICQVRGILEAGALAVVTEEQLPALNAALAANVTDAAAALRQRNYAACDALDAAFHETIVALCGNDLLVQTYRGISNRVRALRNCMPRSHDRYARAVQEHKEISRLISRGDVPAATEKLAGHVRRVEMLLLGPEKSPAR
jgi:DNA-binding GntR family transcriptional regulator